MTWEEELFFERMPDILPVYRELRERLSSRHPDMTVKVTKTQISLRNRYVFAMASLPWRRVKGWPEEYLLISFGLGARKESSRIVQAVEAYPNRWTHHVLIRQLSDIDGELMSWLEEAWQFSLFK